MPNKKTLNLKTGFTLIEIMIVVAIIGLLSTLFLTNWKKQHNRTEDALIKSDLNRLQVAFEDYYTDNNCYPPQTWFDGAEDCNSNHLTQYLSKIPCHPKTHLPYVLEKDSTGCSWFKLFGNLTDTNDSDSFTTIYHNNSESIIYNYAVASSNISLTTPDSNNTYYYCQEINNCTSYDPTLFSCSPSYTNDPNCGESSCPTTSTCTAL